jgi:thiol-disulfide isomerase/thioredoxin
VRRSLLAVPLLLLAACSTGQPTGPGAVPASRVDVDTPALRAAKQSAGVEDCTRTTAPAAADGLPDVTLPGLGGGPGVRLAGLRGPMVVNLFAQWCGPCRRELPHYQQLHEKAGGKVRVLGVDYLDTLPARALELVDQTGVTYPLVADTSGALRSALHIRGLPGVVLLDRDGRVVDVEFREIRSYQELRGLVADKLQVRLPR